MSQPPSTNLKHETITLSAGSISHIWKPQASPPRAVVILQHGFCEYAERYISAHHNFIRSLNTAGYTVYALDMWGHGRSPGTRGVTHLGKAVEYHIELRHLASKEGLPLILFGHSLGGLVTAGSVTRKPDGIRGVIMTGPALPVIPPNPVRALANVLANIIPAVSVPGHGASLDGLTRNKEEIHRFTSDPLVSQRNIPFLIAATALDIMQEINSGLEKWTVPTLVLHGDKDTYTQWEGSEKFVGGIKSEDKTFRRYEDGRHELLHDDCGDEVLGEIMEWIEEHV